jgi:hypothetical protein
VFDGENDDIICVVKEECDSGINGMCLMEKMMTSFVLSRRSVIVEYIVCMVIVNIYQYFGLDK